MNKKNRVFLVVSVLLILIVISGMAIQKMLASGAATIGFPESDFIVLSNGTYEFNDLQLQGHQETSKYAIYALDGMGIVNVGGSEYELTSALFEDTKRRTSGAPLETVLYGILYEESPKINIAPESIIVIKGDDNFKISFVRR